MSAGTTWRVVEADTSKLVAVFDTAAEAHALAEQYESRVVIVERQSTADDLHPLAAGDEGGAS